MNGDPRQSSSLRSRRRDDAIRRKVEQELTRRSQHKGQPQARRKSMTVSSLRPAPAIIITETAKIIQAAQLMAAKRADAVLVVSAEGELTGILTDKDIAFRVVAESLDVRTTAVSQVCTPHPIACYDKGNRNEALNIMVSKKFRHLPVISEGKLDDDDEDAPTRVVGLLDITRCVFDRLDDLEKKVNDDQSIISAMEVLERRGAVDVEQSTAVKSSHGCPDLAYVLNKKATDSGIVVVPEVSIKSSVRDAAKTMRLMHTTAVLVTGAEGDDQVRGIFTTKDIVLRVIAAALDPVTTSVVRVMTPHPDSITPDKTILDALKKMHLGHYVHLPVVDGTTPVGLIDVMTLTVSMLTYLMSKTGHEESEDAQALNDFWNSTFAMPSQESDLDEMSLPPVDRTATPSSISGYQRSQTKHRQQASIAASEEFVPKHRQQSSIAASEEFLPMGHSNLYSFKLKDTRKNKVYRFTSEWNSLFKLHEHVCHKIGCKSLLPAPQAEPQSPSADDLLLVLQDGSRVPLCYVDDDGDIVHLESDKDLEEAISMSRRLGLRSLVIYCGEPSPQSIRQLVHQRSFSGSTRPVTPVTGEPTFFEMIAQVPLPVNVAISAGIVIIAAYVIKKLQ